MRWALALGGALALAACSGPTPSSFGGGDDGGATNDSGVTFPDASDDAPVIGNDGGTNDSGPMQEAVVYGHSPDTLYKVDPNTKAVNVVGMFQNCGGSAVIDLALDKDSNMYVTTFGGFYKVDRTNAHCTEIKTGSYPNSLSFVPKGTVDPNVEALVAYEGSTYVRIDTTTGAITNIGSIGGGLTSSGDIVSVIGGGTYLTVKGANCNDCIVEVNPTTGALIKNWGPVGHTDVFGLAFWAGTAFGFDNGGEIFTITFSGTSVTTQNVPIPNRPPNLQFYGAGSTTSAPPGPR